MCDFLFSVQNSIFVLKDKVGDVGKVQGNGHVEIGQGCRNFDALAGHNSDVLSFVISYLLKEVIKISLVLILTFVICLFWKKQKVYFGCLNQHKNAKQSYFSSKNIHYHISFKSA